MILIKDLGQRKQSGVSYMFALFKCEYCNNEIEKIKRDGIKSNFCSHECYAKNRSPRGAYKPNVIISGYKYIYNPKHPNATKKSYVAEHRLVMEKHIGRFLTPNEIVHHIDENTLNNDLCNLVLMEAFEHNKHHTKQRKRDKYGKFTI